MLEYVAVSLSFFPSYAFSLSPNMISISTQACVNPMTETLLLSVPDYCIRTHPHIQPTPRGKQKKRQNRTEQKKGGKHTLDPQNGAPRARRLVDAVDLALPDAVVEQPLLLVPEVAQAVPLRRDLRVERPHVVVDGARGLGDEVLVERRAAEERLLVRLRVQRPVERDPGRVRLGSSVYHPYQYPIPAEEMVDQVG